MPLRHEMPPRRSRACHPPPHNFLTWRMPDHGMVRVPSLCGSAHACFDGPCGAQVQPFIKQFRTLDVNGDARLGPDDLEMLATHTAAEIKAMADSRVGTPLPPPSHDQLWPIQARALCSRGHAMAIMSIQFGHSDSTRTHPHLHAVVMRWLPVPVRFGLADVPMSVGARMGLSYQRNSKADEAGKQPVSLAATQPSAQASDSDGAVSFHGRLDAMSSAELEALYNTIGKKLGK